MRGSEFAELAAFIAVVEESSFRRAAKRLGLSPSALSHSIRSLEERLGARLLNRTTRSVAMTEAGRMLFERLHPAMSEMEAAVRGVGIHQQQPKGLVRINAPRTAGRMILSPLLAEFRSLYPDVRLDVVMDDTVTDVVSKGFDLGIRSGLLVQQDMVAVELTQSYSMAVVGSPEYLNGRPSPREPGDLAAHACLVYRHDSGELLRWRFGEPARAIEFDGSAISALATNDTDLILSAALTGCGLAFLPEIFVQEHLTAGRLIRLLEDWCQPFPGLHLYYPNRRQVPAAVRAAIDFLESRRFGHA